MLYLVKFFPGSISMIIWFFFFSLLIWWIILINFWMLNKLLYTWNKFHLLMLHISGQFTCLFFISSLESTGTKSHWLHLWTWTLTTRSALLPHIAKPLGGWCWLNSSCALELKAQAASLSLERPTRSLHSVSISHHPAGPPKSKSLARKHYSKNPVHSHINPDQIPLRLGWRISGSRQKTVLSRVDLLLLLSSLERQRK